MARGMGSVFQHRYRDKKTGEWKRTKVWWIQFTVAGKAVHESSRSRHRADAVRLLKQRVNEAATGRVVGPAQDRTTIDDLTAILLNDYTVNHRRSIDRVSQSVHHLLAFFGGERATTVTEDRIIAYQAHRLSDGAANATINRECAALRRAFRLGLWAGRVAAVPHIRALAEDNVRKGFFELEDFESVVVFLPSDLPAVFRTAYITGWRVRSELLTRQWCNVDLRAGWLRIEPGEDKNQSGRMFPLTPELQGVLEDQRAHTTAVEKATGQIIPWVFHRQGKPIKFFYTAWRAACAQAGVARIPHDFRRTAVRNLERAGVPRSAAMAMVGHKTESIYRRYAIADEGMLTDAAQKLSLLHASERGKRRKVVPLKK